MRGIIYGNGGGGSPFGVIEAYYPQNAYECYCYCYADSARTQLILTLKSDFGYNIGRWLFFVPMACYCTLHATGINPIADKTVNITTKGQLETVHLVNRITLVYGAADYNMHVSGDDYNYGHTDDYYAVYPIRTYIDTYTQIKLTPMDTTHHYTGMYVTDNKVVLNHYKKLVYEFESISGGGSNVCVRINTQEHTSGVLNESIVSKSGEIDIGNVPLLDSGYYIVIALVAYINPCTLKIKNLYAE